MAESFPFRGSRGGRPLRREHDRRRCDARLDLRRQLQPVADLASALDDLQQRTGVDVPIHVDGSSGAMIAPFVDSDLVWDFRLPGVASINTSGHKYRPVYPGVGWIVWRDEHGLRDDPSSA